jgi:AAA15 family ATPase/GTPase
MLKSLKLENFRGFKSFELKNLGRINLLVGKNSSGKTSILEAIHLLKTEMELSVLSDIIKNRNEYLFRDQQSLPDLDIKLLFHQRNPQLSDSFLIEASTDERIESLRASLQPWSKQLTQEIALNEGEALSPYSLAIDINQNQKNRRELALSSEISLAQDMVLKRLKYNTFDRFKYIAFSDISQKDLIEFFERIELTEKEELLYQVLKIVHPHIERIAPQRSSQGDFRVLLVNSKTAIPLKHLGGGVWHTLVIALSLLNSQGGVLLIDDIDTGLHYSVMSDLWRQIWLIAKALDVQVFATTHSSDCWQSLAEMANRHETNGDGIRIHRIEQNKSTSIVFDEQKMSIAANREIEVR